MLSIFELFGTIAFAASGAITAYASIIGAVACILLWKYVGQSVAILGGATTVIILRLLAAHYRWSLPKAEI